MTSCQSGSAVRTTASRNNHYLGDGQGTPASTQTQVTQVLLPGASSRRTTLLSEGTASGTVGLASVSYELGQTSNGPFNAAALGPSTDLVQQAVIGQGPHLEVTSSSVGRDASVEVTSYSYVYRGDGGVTGLTQHLSREERSSVVPTAPAGAKARHHSVYDATGRLQAEFWEGYTRVAGSTPNAVPWTTQQRYIGKFYLNPDSRGRAQRIEGPCIVSGTTVSACSGSFPLTSLTYHAGGGLNANMLAAVSRYPSGVGSTPLVTQFANYDEFGNARTITDENNVTTSYVFTESRPISYSKDGKTWTYQYDRRFLTRVTRPDGDFDVICYRRLPTSLPGDQTACPSSASGAAPSEVPTGIFRYPPGGGSWREATVFVYGLDGEVREELQYSQGNTTTPFRRTTRERNGLGFPTFEKTGPAPNGNVERVARQFSADGLVIAQSTPYFTAPDFCGTPGAPSDLCTQFSYWNTGRLKKMSMSQTGSPALNIGVCLDYDAHGNVIGVQPDCTTTGMHSYVWDDFGKVTQATLANTDATRPIRFEYDARGNLIRKGIAAPQGGTTLLEWDYDQLNRPVANRENGTTVLRWYYDNAGVPTVPGGCTALASTANQKGRLTVASDAVVFPVCQDTDARGNWVC